MPITGHTNIIAVLGDPISAARTPESLGVVIAELELDVVVVPVGLAPEGLAEFVSAARAWRNLSGIIVTMPHKAPMSELVDRLSAQARLTAAVNLVLRADDGTLSGEQLDGEGFVGSLLDRGVVLTGASVVLLGAGGVARSIAFSIAAEGIRTLTIVNRSSKRALALKDDLKAAFETLEVSLGEETAAKEADLIINATSIGSLVQPGLPIDPAVIRPGSLVADVVANPARTALLAAAEARGATIHPGDLMQRAQFATIVRLTTGTVWPRP